LQALSTRHTATLPLSVRGALYLFAGLTGVCLLTELFCYFVLHLGGHYVWPLPPHENRFCDFWVYYDRFPLFHSPGFFAELSVPTFAYPPAAAAALAVFYSSAKPLPFFLAAMVCCFGIAAALFARVLLREGVSLWETATVVVFFGLSYPLLIGAQQANCEWIVWVVLTAGLWCYVRNWFPWAAVLLGLAAALKLYPIILLGLFVARRQYRWIALALATCLLATLASMRLESGSIALSLAGTIHGIGDLNQSMMLIPMTFWDHSLFELFKKTAVFIHSAPLSAAAFRRLEHFYLVVMAITGIVLFFTRIRKLPLLNQILCLTGACVLLPPVSMDYTFMEVFLPCALLIVLAIRSAKSGHLAEPPGLRAALLFLACLFSPTTEFTLYGYTISAFLHTVALLGLLVVSLRYPFELVEPFELREPTPDTTAALAM